MVEDFWAEKSCRHSRLCPQTGLLARLALELLSVNLDLGKVPTVPSMIRVTLCARTVCANNLAYVTHLLSLWESGILVCARHPPLIITLRGLGV